MKHLESEVERRTKELKRLVKHMKKMKEKAEEADRLKSAFLSNMSHEIRTPMNAILGFTTLLNQSGLSDDDKAKYITYIQNSGKNLLTLINDIIDIAKIEAKQLKFEYSKVDLNQLLDELREQTMNQVDSMEKAQLKVSTSKGQEHLIMVTDPNRLRQVLSNLLINAVKFTDEGEIKFGYELKKDKIQFFVKDTGIGIPEIEFKEIFRRFGQSNCITSSNHKGTGLGLAISKNIVELLHGEIWVESVVGEGSCFYFLLPLEEAQNGDQAEKKETPAGPSLQKLKDKSILVVEDVEENFWLIKELLKEYGPKISWAKDGDEAISMLTNEKKYDLVLLDIKMPGKNGFDTLDIMKKQGLKNIPVIAQTAYALSNEHEKCLQAGFDDYISKPMEKSKLLKTVSKWL
jgi:CheY-like chemotaxis protein